MRTVYSVCMRIFAIHAVGLYYIVVQCNKGIDGQIYNFSFLCINRIRTRKFIFLPLASVHLSLNKLNGIVEG